ncbi:hypothetical protein BJ508DRAFT_315595 [Ascobolus immersus RN42]|uniref:Uncharacterized protein n=1 Tax=Ascobolus immersus RN42 TaxID=1160509 RepID=A0A3N4HCN5_ASCIM|nr:hypothetical protein BJ508DRAFT_315595 [Ascobolus immersus RN42]
MVQIANPTGALPVHVNIISCETGKALTESMPGKKHARLTVAGSSKPHKDTPIQEHHVKIQLPYKPEPQAIEIQLRAFADAINQDGYIAPVANFYEDMKPMDMIALKATYDGVENATWRPIKVCNVQNGEKCTTGRALCRKEEIKDDTVKDGKKTVWVDYRLDLVAGEETKKGEISVLVAHRSNFSAYQGSSNGVGAENRFKDGSAFILGEEVRRRDAKSIFSTQMVKTLARIHFHYEVEGKREKELKEELEREAKRKEEEYKEMLERQNAARIKDLRKTLAKLSTEETKSVDAIKSDEDSSDGEAEYQCQFCGGHNCDEYHCYDCHPASDSEGEKSESEGWEKVPGSEEYVSETSTSKARGWFFNRS